jgi:isoquinoline 1-oxidoreductase subunit beta
MKNSVPVDSTLVVNRFKATRRQFLKQSSGLTFAFTFANLLACSEIDTSRAKLEKNVSPLNLNAYVNISPKGIVTIINPAAEMGQGVMTALPIIVAEEMDVDWNKVRIESSPAFGEVYGDPLFFNKIFTTSSRSVNNYYERLRQFGAQARQFLLQNAANVWDIPVEELTSSQGVVIHKKSGRELSYAEIVAFADTSISIAEVPQSQYKHKNDYQLVGKNIPRRDIPAKVNGTAKFSMDVKPEGLVYAAVSRAPIEGATVKSVDEGGARSVNGVIDILIREESVAVIASSYSTALKARTQLRISWHEVGDVNKLDGETAMLEHISLARDLSVKGFAWDSGGDAPALLDATNQIFEREYQTDNVYHAQMEPLNAVVSVTDAGQQAEVWAGTQAPANTVDAVAKFLDIDTDKVKLHRTFLGGGFGRRTVRSMDFVVDAVWLSKALQKPVKVVWTREDDLSNGHLKPMSAHFLRACFDDQGDIAAWQHRVVSEESTKRLDPSGYEAFGKVPITSMLGSSHHTMGRTLGDAYDLPNRLVEHLPFDSGLRLYPVRGVGAAPNTLAIESFLDELATHQKRDPLKLRLQLLANSERGRLILETVAEMANWDQKREGRALGIAYTHYVDTAAAAIAEVSYDDNNSKILVHKVWAAVDAGLAIQPDNIKAQVEGGVVHGLSFALKEQITIKEGLIQESNFHDYPLMRMADTPEIQVRVLQSDRGPSGIGETGTILAPAAVANAFAALTNTRLRHMPFTGERIQQAMNS